MTGIVLGIETSCDETGVGVVRLGSGGTVALLADEIASSVDEHARFGGVVPEVASRALGHTYTAIYCPQQDRGDDFYVDVAEVERVLDGLSRLRSARS